MPLVHVPAQANALLRVIGDLADRERMSAFAVGGCVRDWRLGVTSRADLDIAVEGDGIQLARRVAYALGGSLHTHQQFGTATVVIPRPHEPRMARDRARVSGTVRLDLATCRSETYARPAAYPRVSPGTLEGDLFRRDFTLNAMAVALAPSTFGRLLDPFHGARDLTRRRLRMLHDRSFLDDPTRLLRGVRFAQRFGFAWEPRTARAACEALAAGALSWLNAGRLQRELDRLLDEPDPLACFQALASLLVDAGRDPAAPIGWRGSA